MNHLWSGCLQLCSCQFSAAYNKTLCVLGVAVRCRKAQVCVPYFCFHTVGSGSMLQSAGAVQLPAAWAGRAVAALVLSLGDVVLSARVEPERGACPLFKQEAVIRAWLPFASAACQNTPSSFRVRMSNTPPERATEDDECCILESRVWVLVFRCCLLHLVSNSCTSLRAGILHISGCSIFSERVPDLLLFIFK